MSYLQLKCVKHHAEYLKIFLSHVRMVAVVSKRVASSFFFLLSIFSSPCCENKIFSTSIEIERELHKGASLRWVLENILLRRLKCGDERVSKRVRERETSMLEIWILLSFSSSIEDFFLNLSFVREKKKILIFLEIKNSWI